MFKIGDIVEVVRGEPYAKLHVGTKWTVTDTSEGNGFAYVHLDGVYGGWQVDRFKLFEEKKVNEKKYYIQRQVLKPVTYEQALKHATNEAKRGYSYLILEAVEVVKPVEPAVEKFIPPE